MEWDEPDIAAEECGQACTDDAPPTDSLCATLVFRLTTGGNVRAGHFRQLRCSSAFGTGSSGVP